MIEPEDINSLRVEKIKRIIQLKKTKKLSKSVFSKQENKTQNGLFLLKERISDILQPINDIEDQDFSFNEDQERLALFQNNDVKNGFLFSRFINSNLTTGHSYLGKSLEEQFLDIISPNPETDFLANLKGNLKMINSLQNFNLTVKSVKIYSIPHVNQYAFKIKKNDFLDIKQFAKSTNNIGTPSEEENNFIKYPCKIKNCERVFLRADALGGHMSRSHPFCSQTFIKRQHIRKLRELDRDLRNKAKDLLTKGKPFFNNLPKAIQLIQIKQEKEKLKQCLK